MLQVLNQCLQPEPPEAPMLRPREQDEEKAVEAVAELDGEGVGDSCTKWHPLTLDPVRQHFSHTPKVGPESPNTERPP